MLVIDAAETGDKHKHIEPLMEAVGISQIEKLTGKYERSVKDSL
jgi:hypothetical protein